MSNFSKLLIKLKNSLIDMLFPEGLTCVNCGREIKKNETRYNFCADCISKLPFIEGHKCISCGAPINNEADYCDNCTRFDKSFDANRASLCYDGTARELIKKLKFGNKRYVAKELAKMMCDTFIEEGLSADVAVFVPMTDKELKERGYNQSQLLAEEVTKRLGIPLSDCLKKVKDTDRQKKLTAKERHENMKGVFDVLGKGNVSRKKVLLIDDVFTTGATVNECAAVLKKSGAVKVYSLTACITIFKPESETS